MAIRKLIDTVVATLARRGAGELSGAPKLPRRFNPVVEGMQRHQVADPAALAELQRRNLIMPPGATIDRILEAHEWMRVEKLGPQSHSFLRELEGQHLTTHTNSQNLVGQLEPGTPVVLLAKPSVEGGPMRVVSGPFSSSSNARSSTFYVGDHRFTQHDIVSLGAPAQRPAPGGWVP